MELCFCSEAILPLLGGQLKSRQVEPNLCEAREHPAVNAARLCTQVRTAEDSATAASTAISSVAIQTDMAAASCKLSKRWNLGFELRINFTKEVQERFFYIVERRHGNTQLPVGELEQTSLHCVNIPIWPKLVQAPFSVDRERAMLKWHPRMNVFRRNFNACVSGN